MPTGTRGEFIAGPHYNEVREQFPAPHQSANWYRNGGGGGHIPPTKKTAVGPSDPQRKGGGYPAGPYWSQNPPGKYNSLTEEKLANLKPSVREDSKNPKAAPAKKGKTSYSKEK